MSNSINPNQNYARLTAPGWVNTGQQIINLLSLAPRKEIEAMLLLDIWETDEPASDPDDRYGIPPKDLTNQLP